MNTRPMVGHIEPQTYEGCGPTDDLSTPKGSTPREDAAEPLPHGDLDATAGRPRTATPWGEPMDGEFGGRAHGWAVLFSAELGRFFHEWQASGGAA